MIVIINVPANSGMAPKDPEPPAWPSRIAICGLQWVPNKKSLIGIVSKKRLASKVRDKIIPTVVNIATPEANCIRRLTMVSTLSRAAKRGEISLAEKTKPSIEVAAVAK